MTLQEGDSFSHIYSRVWFVWPWFKQIFTKADRIQAISKYLAEWAKKMGAVCPVDVVPNGVDVSDYRLQTTDYRRESRQYIRQKFNIPLDASWIISASRLVEKNGLSDLIQAVNFLPNTVHLILAGSGGLEDRLRNEAANLGLRDRVHFVGNVNHDQLPSYLAASNVFCRPSLSEGLGSAFLEAMAAGVPVIATPVGGIPDFLKDGETGWFCEIKNPKSIAEKIQYVLDEKNKAEVERVVENARQMVQNQYSWEKIANQMNRLFASLQMLNQKTKT